MRTGKGSNAPATVNVYSIVGLNPFENREGFEHKKQKYCNDLGVLIPLRTGKGSNGRVIMTKLTIRSLNPFENREGFERKAKKRCVDD